MSRLTRRFETLRSRGEKALICFITAGDPSADKTVALITALDHAGADAVEIGIPFSDPLADGPSIQASSQRSLEAGMTTARSLDIVRRARIASPSLPIVMMTYFNPIRHFGLDRYAAAAAEAGADAHIVTDLTPEEAGDWTRISADHGLDTVFLLAPTSTEGRINVVCGLSSGFVYCVSRTGVTGVRQDVPVELTGVVGRIKAHTDLPVCAGFGISQPEHVARICAFADGAVVGSSLVDLIHRKRDDTDLIASVTDYVSALKAATGG